MKLQNLTVIFIIIVLPVLLVLSYYMSLQINTINMQTAFDSKIINSTKSAIQAYEINTVEWNSDYSQHPDSQRRDVMASIESFTTSFANGLGLSGTNKENVLTYIPAIAYTLYDGYYIYTPSEVYLTVLDENEVTVVLKEILVNNGSRGNLPSITLGSGGFHKDDEGKVLYQVASGYSSDGTYTDVNGESHPFTFDPSKAKTEYKHILKPFSSYSKTYYSTGAVGVDVDEKGDDINLQNGDTIIVNYTLDNYVKVYVQRLNTIKEGYLTDKVEVKKDKRVDNVYHGGTLVSPEELSENIAYYEDTDPDNIKFHYNVPYVYEIGNKTKVYLDTTKDVRFVLEGNRRVDLTLDTTEEKKHFKKVTVPHVASGTYMEIYQDLVTKKWYGKNFNVELSPVTIYDMSDADIAKYGIKKDIKYDYSGINYCVESLVFTGWVNDLNMDGFPGRGYEDLNDDFVTEKREVIKQTLEANLSQAISSYSEHTVLEYVMPTLSETDWDQILTNVSIVTFVQNMPIGLKYYNNYAIATSSLNAEYVDPDELYISDKSTGDTYYHKLLYCTEIKGNNLMAYRNTDYVAKSYPNGTYDAEGNEQTNFYFRHTYDQTNAKKACYYCLIQRELSDASKSISTNALKAYNTGLARERYVAKRIKLPPQASPSYFIYVRPVYNDGTNANEAWTYTFNGGEVHTETTDKTITPQIPKEYATYHIQGVKSDTLIESKSPSMYGDFTNPVVMNDINETYTTSDGKVIYRFDPTKPLPEGYGAASSEADTFIYTEYDPAIGLSFNVDIQRDTVMWGRSYEKGLDFSHNTSGSDYIDTKDFGGYINVKLVYNKNYTETTELDAFANIDDKNCITIGTDLKAATGYLRVVYKNKKGSDTITYCTDILNVTAPNTKIFFKIPNDTLWAPNNWEVTVCNLRNEIIYKNASGLPQTFEITKYTIKTEKGLTGFSYATNNKQDGAYAKTEGRTFLLINNVSLSSTFTPICTKELKTNNPERRFRGVFRGDWLFDDSQNWIRAKTASEADSKITNLKQATTAYVYNLGLFGFVDGEAVLSHFEINNVAIINTDADWQTGTVAGFIGEKAKAEYVKVTYDKNKVQGRADVGGIVGHNNGTIDNCSYEGKSVSGTVAKKYNCGVGGIAGYNYGDLTNCTCNSPISGIDECYNIGGIVGYNGSTAGKKVANNTFKGSSVSGGDNCLNIGGIVGLNGSISALGVISTTDTTVRDISSNKLEGTGTVQGGENCRNIGGVVGCNIYGKFSSNECVKNVTAGKDSQCIGGIVGYTLNGDIQGSKYSNGAVKCVNSSGNAAAGDYIGGLAGYSKNATIKNNTCSSVSVTVGESSQYIGGMVGCSVKGTFEGNNHSGGAVSTGNSSTYVGGIIGYSDDTDIKSSSNSKASITSGNASMYIGGIVGRIDNGIISNSNNTSSAITSGNYSNNIGGIAGYTSNVDLTSCNCSTSAVTSGYSSSNVGGIVGYSVKGTFNSNNYSNAIITVYSSHTNKSNNVGGIVGYINGTAVNSSICTGNTINVGEETRNVGGIAGQAYGTNSMLYDCVNEGTVDAGTSFNVGGIVGYLDHAWAHYCRNTGSVTGKGSNEDPDELTEGFLGDRVYEWYAIGDTWVCGTGGISGYNREGKITESSNNGAITGELNVGGITGVLCRGTVQYCCNKKDAVVRSTERNRTGGIVGAASSGVTVTYCYNTGTIKGVDYSWATDWDDKWVVLLNGVGGIIGNIDDNRMPIVLENILKGETVFTSDQSLINNCYNAGDLKVFKKGTNTEGTPWLGFQRNHLGQIIGGVLNAWNTILNPGAASWSPDTQHDALWINHGSNTNNIYLEKTITALQWIRGAHDTLDGAVVIQGWDRDVSRSLVEISPLTDFHGYTSSQLKSQLNGLTSSGKYVTQTSSSNLGYDGYGILYWEVYGPTNPDTVYRCTVNCSGTGQYRIEGNFVKANGDSDGTTKTANCGTSITFYVKYSSNIVRVHRTYYEDKQIAVVNNNQNENVTLNKKKYYATLSEAGPITLKNNSRNVTASWSGWTSEEISNIGSKTWTISNDGFEYDTKWAIENVHLGSASITYGTPTYPQKMPSSMNIRLFTDAHYGLIIKTYLNTEFTLGTVWAEIND